MENLIKTINFDFFAEKYLNIIGFAVTSGNLGKVRLLFGCSVSAIIDKIIALDEVCRLPSYREEKDKTSGEIPDLEGELWEI